MNFFRLLLGILFFGSPLFPVAIAKAANVSTNRIALIDSAQKPIHRFRVAVFERPPYSFKDEDGAWTGLSIDLWEQIAGRLGITFDYVEMPLSEVYNQLRVGTCDLSPVIPISSEKSDQIEFTEPYLFSHGALLTQHSSFRDSLNSFRSFIWSKEMLFICFAMFTGMVLFSLLLMLVERKYEGGHFSEPSVKGLGSALWFSAVTMTTVGYGDKTPLSAIGRIITFLWMLVGVILIAVFTGTVASSITTAELQNRVLRFNEVSSFSLGCFEGSRMDLLLKTRGVPAIRYSSPEAGFEGLKKGSINAYVGDSVTLEYLMTHNAPGGFKIFMIPDAAMMYAFAAKPHLVELAEINRNLLRIALAIDWRSKAEKWTGPLSL